MTSASLSGRGRPDGRRDRLEGTGRVPMGGSGRSAARADAAVAGRACGAWGGARTPGGGAGARSRGGLGCSRSSLCARQRSCSMLVRVPAATALAQSPILPRVRASRLPRAAGSLLVSSVCWASSTWAQGAPPRGGILVPAVALESGRGAASRLARPSVARAPWWRSGQESLDSWAAWWAWPSAVGVVSPSAAEPAQCALVRSFCPAAADLEKSSVAGPVRLWAAGQAPAAVAGARGRLDRRGSAGVMSASSTMLIWRMLVFQRT